MISLLSLRLWTKELTRERHERKLSGDGRITMTARSHQAVRVGLRRLLRDKNVEPKALMKAIELLMKVEGLMDAEIPKNKPTTAPMSKPNNNRLRELTEMTQVEKSD